MSIETQARDAASIFSHNMTSSGAWPPAVMLRVFLRYINPLFGTGTPLTTEDVSCVAVDERPAAWNAERENEYPKLMRFSCRTSN